MSRARVRSSSPDRSGPPPGTSALARSRTTRLPVACGRAAPAGRRANARWRGPEVLVPRGPSYPAAAGAVLPPPPRSRLPRSRPARRSPRVHHRATPARTSRSSRAHPLHEPARSLDELVLVEALELRPRRQRAGIADPIHEQDPVEVVELVLERPGGEPAPHLVVLVAVAVEVTQPDAYVTRHLAAEVRDGEAALVDLHDLLVEWLNDRVHDHGERHRRLVGIAWVVGPHLHDRHPHRLAHLVCGKPGAVGRAHRLDHVVDQALHRL